MSILMYIFNDIYVDGIISRSIFQSVMQTTTFSETNSVSEEVIFVTTR